MRLWSSLLAAALLTSCATAGPAGTCPDSRDQRCLGAVLCGPDRQRGCMVCRCSSTSLDADEPAARHPGAGPEGAQRGPPPPQP